MGLLPRTYDAVYPQEDGGARIIICQPQMNSPPELRAAPEPSGHAPHAADPGAQILEEKYWKV